MGRTDKRGANPLTPEVESIEVSDKNIKLRVVGVVLSLIVAVSALAYAVSALTTADKGWQTIPPTGDVTYTSEFALTYNVGASGASARRESRDVKAAYSQALADAGQALDVINAAPGNLRTLNDAPNEAVELNPVLYSALELLERRGDRTMYLGPAYKIYDNVFSCGEDWQLADFDPERNPRLEELFARIAAYAADPESVNIRLLGDNRAILNVSDEYMDFLEAEELDRVVDLYWMKNAFIVDYVADELISGGFTWGAVSSADGYCRNLDGEEESYSLNIFASGANGPIVACRLDYAGPAALVSFRAFPLSDGEKWYYYVTEDGQTKARYLEVETAMPCSAADSLTAMSKTLSCAETMLRSAPAFLGGTPDAEALTALTADGIDALCPADNVILTTVPEHDLQGVYPGWTVKTADD